MKTFVMLSSEWKSVILISIYLLIMMEFLQILILHEHAKKKQELVTIGICFATFAGLISLNTDFYEDSGRMIHLPIIVIVCIFVFMFLVICYRFLIELQQEKQELNADSIKEAFDSLPVGLCFFDMNGIPFLCNQKMYDLVYELTGKDLQTMHELNSALIHPEEDVECITSGNEKLYRLLDGTTWTLHKSNLVLSDGATYWQYSATDVTELYGLQKELETDNAEVQDMIEQVQKINENMAVIVRQQEILNAKMRIHNKMGNCLLMARQYYMTDMPTERKEQLVNLWKDSLDALMSEVGSEDDTDACDEVIRIAEKIGVEVSIKGRMPEDEKLAYLLVVALRECVTNAVRHAKATQLVMQISYTNRYVECSFRNNGIPPEKAIEEGGGLTSLRQKINNADGTMRIQSAPEFVLRIQLPLFEVR